MGNITQLVRAAARNKLRSQDPYPGTVPPGCATTTSRACGPLRTHTCAAAWWRACTSSAPAWLPSPAAWALASYAEQRWVAVPAPADRGLGRGPRGRRRQGTGQRAALHCTNQTSRVATARSVVRRVSDVDTWLKSDRTDGDQISRSLPDGPVTSIR